MEINSSFYIYTCPNNNNRQIKQKVLSFRGHDFLDLPEKDIFEKLKETVTPENFLGQGTEAEVYRIKGTDYCVRIPHLSLDIYRFGYTKELTPIDKVNHVVAKLGFGASIMKYFDGIVPKWYQKNEYNRHKLQENIAQMPVKSYSDLLHQIAGAVDNEMLFDFSGGNLIVNTEKQKLTAIDFNGITDNPRPVRPLSEMYSVLTSYGSEEKTGKKIFDKIVDAGLKEFRKKSIPCMDVALFDFLELCLKRMGNAFTPDGEKLKSIIMHNGDLLKDLKKREIRDKSVSELLGKQLKTFKSLLKRVR